MTAIAAALWFATIVRTAKWLQSPRLTPAVGTIVVLTSLAALTSTNTRLFSAIGIGTAVVSAMQQILLLGACVGAEIVVAGIAVPAGLNQLVRRLIVRAGLVGGAVVALFTIAPEVPAGLTVYQFAAQYAGNAYFGTAFLLVQLYAGLACARVAFFAGKLLRDEPLRIPMVLLAAGASIFTFYAVLRSGSLIAALVVDFEPHLTVMFTVMSYVAAVGVVLLIASFCWVPGAHLARSIRHLLRQGPLYCQVTQFDPGLRVDWRVGGLSLSRRADVHATAILDFLTLLLPGVQQDSRPAPDPRRIASWLALPSEAQTRPTVHSGMLSPPSGVRPAAWLDEVLQHLPGGRAALLADLQDSSMNDDSASSRTIPADRAARIITEASAPWLVNTAAALYVGVVARSFSWGLFAALIAGVGPILAILAFMRVGRATDHHVGHREHRTLVVAMIVAFMAIGVGIEVVAGAPRQILVLSIAGLVTILAVGVVTTGLKYKVSVHTAVWAGTAGLLAALVHPAWLLGLAIVPAIAWARVRVRDHTIAQTITGAVLGLATVALTLAAI